MGSIPSNFAPFPKKWNFSYSQSKPHEQEELLRITHHYISKVIIYLYIYLTENCGHHDLKQ